MSLWQLQMMQYLRKLAVNYADAGPSLSASVYSPALRIAGEAFQYEYEDDKKCRKRQTIPTTVHWGHLEPSK